MERPRVFTWVQGLLNHRSGSKPTEKQPPAHPGALPTPLFGTPKCPAQDVSQYSQENVLVLSHGGIGIQRQSETLPTHARVEDRSPHQQPRGPATAAPTPHTPAASIISTPQLGSPDPFTTVPGIPVPGRCWERTAAHTHTPPSPPQTLHLRLQGEPKSIGRKRRGSPPTSRSAGLCRLQSAEGSYKDPSGPRGGGSVGASTAAGRPK